MKESERKRMGVKEKHSAFFPNASNSFLFGQKSLIHNIYIIYIYVIFLHILVRYFLTSSSHAVRTTELLVVVL